MKYENVKKSVKKITNTKIKNTNRGHVLPSSLSGSFQDVYRTAFLYISAVFTMIYILKLRQQPC